ncbi:MAG: hypothetical protein ACOYBY_10120 [Dermatophilaceae bacterium]
MGIFDRLFGRPEVSQEPMRRSGAVTAYPPAGRSTSAGPQDSTTGATAADEGAIARYRYLLRTAPPERIEQLHADAFARLSPQQRQAVLAELTRTLPAEEAPRADEPQAMARAATRAELAHPGYLQNAFGRTGIGLGGMVAGTMLGTIAAAVVGSALADTLLGGFEQSPEAAQADSPGDSAGDSGWDDASDEQAWGDVQADFGTDLDGFRGGYGDSFF